MTGLVSNAARLCSALYGARWAGVYLAAAGALIAVAGSEVAAPSPDEHARKIELRIAGELGPLADAASAVAGSVARERVRFEAERKAKLNAALASARSWLRGAASAGNTAEALARSAGELVPLIPSGIAVAVVGSVGEPLFECGGSVDLDSPQTRVEPAGLVEPGGSLMADGAVGLTLAAAWTEPPPEALPAAQAALSSALSGAAPAGTGLYFVGPEGDLAAEISTRPVRAAPLAPTIAARSPLDGASSHIASGDLETGKLLTVRRACPAFSRAQAEPDATGPGMGWTAVAERFVTPEELAEGAPRGFGMMALTALGLVAAAAFAHAVRAGVLGGKRRSTDNRGAPRPERRPPHVAPATRPAVGYGCAPRPPATAGAHVDANVEAEPVPTGRSILRLREALGTPAEGPDIAACARSPILRALSRSVRSPRPLALPREVREWGARNARGAPPVSINLRKSA